MTTSSQSSHAIGLPQAGEKYSQEAFQALLDYIKQLEERVYLRRGHVEIWAPPDSGGRKPLLILRSDDGSIRYAISVDGAGLVIATDILDLGL
jgi:hypothetical protein